MEIEEVKFRREGAVSASDTRFVVEKVKVSASSGLEKLLKAAARMENLTKGNADGERPSTRVEIKRTSLADTVFTATTTFLTGAIETIVLLYFLLAYGEVFLQKLVKVLPNFHDKQEA